MFIKVTLHKDANGWIAVDGWNKTITLPSTHNLIFYEFTTDKNSIYLNPSDGCFYLEENECFGV